MIGRGTKTAWSYQSPKAWTLGSFSDPSCFAALPQLEQVVCGGYHAPLTLNRAVSTPHEAATSSHPLDLVKHRLYHPATSAVQLPSPLGSQLTLHPLQQRQVLGNPSAGRALLSQCPSLLPVLRRSNQHFGVGELLQAALQPVLVLRSHQAGHERFQGQEQDRISSLHGLDAQGDRQVGLPHPRRGPG